LIVGEDRKKARIEKFNQKNEAKYSFLDDIRDADGNRPGKLLYIIFVDNMMLQNRRRKL
jgi:hypothetical protein